MKEEIKKFFRGDADDSAETLSKYSRDASIFEVRPKLVLFPKDSLDVENLVKWAREYKELAVHPGNPGADISITARCAGTDMSGGAIGESIILDFTRYMNRLIGGPLPLDVKHKYKKGKSYPAVDSYVTVEPGMMYRDFEKITLAKGLILPCYTASKNINAMGGMFGNNSAGERTLKYGQMENYVLSSRAVFADGNVYEVKPLTRDELTKKMAQGDFEGNLYKNIFDLIQENKEEIRHAKPNVSKNSAGYYLWNVMRGDYNSAGFRFDLNKLLVGSQGTLGIITEMTVKVLPEHKHSQLAAVFMDDLGPLGRVVDDILALEPESLETYDDRTINLAVKFFPSLLRGRGFGGALRFLKNLMPEFKIVFKSFLAGKLPKLVILVEFAGSDPEALRKKCANLSALLQKYGLKARIAESAGETEKYWAIRRESFALLRKHAKGMHTAPFIDDIIVRPEFLPKFLPELNALLSRYQDKLIYTLAGHAGNGNFHIIPLMDFRRKSTGKTIIELAGKVFELVSRYRGSLAAEHNDGLIRTPYLGLMYSPDMLAVFAKTKNIFDPHNLLNPGKKVPLQGKSGLWAPAGTKEYLALHVAEEHKAPHKS